MRSSTASDARAQVVVIGAGPSGLFAAAELARHGVPARVVEREPVPHRQARATALQPGTLEILARPGVVDKVLAASVHLGCARVFDASLQPVSELAFAGVGCPWEFQCSLPQWRTEQILAERLVELGGVVEPGVAAASVEERDDGAMVRLERADGTPEAVEAAWVVGAGGAHSVTRASMAEALEGLTYPGTALAADVRVRCGLPRDGSNLVAAPEGYVLLAPLPDERWITFVGDLDDGEAERVASATPRDAVAAAIARRVAADLAVEDVGWAAPLMHHRVVSRLAQGRRFLLGDAGHLSSPFGGEGLNSGLHDAHDIAWRLALWLGGRARPALLESFEPERLAADGHVLEVSNLVDGLVRAAVESARTGVRRSPATPAQLAALARSRCMLDVKYADSPLVGEHLGPGVEPPAVPRPATAILIAQRSRARSTTSCSSAPRMMPASSACAAVGADSSTSPTRPATQSGPAFRPTARFWYGPTGTSALAPRPPTPPGWRPSTPTSTPTSSPAQTWVEVTAPRPLERVPPHSLTPRRDADIPALASSDC